MKAIKVADILKDGNYQLDLRLVGGKNGLSKEVTVPRIQKPGLALAGYLEQIHPDRIQVLGSVELSYLSTLLEKRREEAIERLCSRDIAYFVITRGVPVPRVLIQEANNQKIPSSLVGKGTDLIKYHMIRGIGIVNVRDIFGIMAVRDEKEIEIVIELIEWPRGRT